jgi:hypothetical protein
MTILREIPMDLQLTPWLRALNGYWMLSVFLLVPAAGFAVGWVNGFPNWSYPYVSQAYLFALYLSVASTPGIEIFGYPLFGREMWGARAWIPLLVAVLAALLVMRSPSSFIKLFTNLWDDWTLGTFGLFGLMPFLGWLLFDEIERSYSLPFMVLMSLVTCGTAWYYLRVSNRFRRAIILFTGALVTLLLASLGPWYYGRLVGTEWVNVPYMLVFTAVVLVILFSPALIGLIRSLSRPSQTAQ